MLPFFSLFWYFVVFGVFFLGFVLSFSFVDYLMSYFLIKKKSFLLVQFFSFFFLFLTGKKEIEGERNGFPVGEGRGKEMEAGL